MEIRLAQPTDISQIIDLVAKVIPAMHKAGNYQWARDYPNEAVFVDDIDKAQLWVADLNGKIAGVSAITTDQDPEYVQAGWDIEETAIVMHRLAVDPDCHGLGIASKLMAQAEIVAKKNGIPILRVDTSSENKATQALFPKLGYQFSGEITLARRPGQRFFCYEKLL